MALGIACAGTGSKEALAVLEPMFNDAVNYVGQGVLIAMSLVCVQLQFASTTESKIQDIAQNANEWHYGQA